MIMNFGRPDPRARVDYNQMPQDPRMAQIHNAYQTRIAELEQELAVARQYIARLQGERAQRGGAPAPKPPVTQPPAIQVDPSLKAFYGDHLGCSHPYDVDSDEMED